MRLLAVDADPPSDFSTLMSGKVAADDAEVDGVGHVERRDE